MSTIRTAREIKILEEGGKILASILNELAARIKPGLVTVELEKRARDLVGKAGGRPSFLSYRPPGAKRRYPAALCVSINDEVVHGLPSKERILKEGDLVSLDLGLEYKNFFTDMAVTVGAGKLDREAERLVRVTEEALWAGIKELKAGARLGDYGDAVQSLAEKNGFSVVRNLVGHGIGRFPHEDADIPNWGKKGQGRKLENGMVLALEPMLCQGGPEVKLAKDGWVWKTRDGLLSAHFEHTIVVEKDFCRVLTKI
jgi:methionyl aminopeptidase